MQLPPRARLLKYAAASAVGVVMGSSLLLFFLHVLGWAPVNANLASVTISSLPAYLINRHWVWQKTDGHSVKREIVPFWTMAFLGLLLSTVLVGYAESHTDNSLVILGANLAGFGLLWVAKFFVLDRVLFAATPEEHLEPPPLL